MPFKKNTKRISHRVSSKKEKNNLYRQYKNNNNKINVIFNGNIIINF